MLHGTQVVQTVRPYAAADLGRRVRVLWQGAEYRGRGRETLWQGKLTLAGNRIARFAPVNFLNPERKVRETDARHRAGLDLGDDRQSRRHRSLARRRARAARCSIETNVVSGEVDLAALADDAVAFDGGGLGRKLSVYRLPEADWSRRVALEHTVTFSGRRRPAGLSCA